MRGKPGDGAEGGFLGGTHSVRPRCEAVPMPRHNMIIGGKRTPGGLMGRSPGGSKVSLGGVRSPSLRGGQASARGFGRKFRDNAEGDFLGGAHSVRPHSMAIRVPMNSICTPRRGERPVAYRGHVSVKPGPSLRACGARPSAGWAIQARTALRGKPGDGAEGGFLGGTHSVRPDCRAGRRGFPGAR